MPEGLKNNLNEIQAVIKEGLTGVTTGGQVEIR
jgi:hypothetical protein